MSVNAFPVKELWDPRERNVRLASRTMCVEAAVRLLERCTEWRPREELVNLPNCYFNVSGGRCATFVFRYVRVGVELMWCCWADDEPRWGSCGSRDQGDFPA